MAGPALPPEVLDRATPEDVVITLEPREPEWRPDAGVPVDAPAPQGTPQPLPRRALGIRPRGSQTVYCPTNLSPSSSVRLASWLALRAPSRGPPGASPAWPDPWFVSVAFWLSSASWLPACDASRASPPRPQRVSTRPYRPRIRGSDGLR